MEVKNAIFELQRKLKYCYSTDSSYLGYHGLTQLKITRETEFNICPSGLWGGGGFLNFILFIYLLFQLISIPFHPKFTFID